MLKKDDPQIIANKISKNKSKVLASLISSCDCIYVISAYQVYIFSYTLKNLRYICSVRVKKQLNLFKEAK